MAEEEKTFEEIKEEAGLAEEAPGSDDSVEENPSEEKPSEENSSEENEAPAEEGESLSDAIEEEFPPEEGNAEASEDGEEGAESEGKKDAEEPPSPPPVNKPWIDFKNMDFKRDASTLFKRPFYIIVLVLGVLLLALFVAMFIEYKAEEYSKSLEGYVRTNFKAPEWHHGELPDNLKEVIHNYEEKKRKAIEEKLLIHPDPKAKEPIIGRNYPNAINNNTLKEILRKQNIGEVTEEGVVRTELMNLSGLDMSKLNYKYFYNMVAANLRYASFNNVEREGLLFRGASLQYSQFVGAIIPKTNFVRAKLSFANFYEAITDASLFNNVVAEKAHFQASRLVSSNFNNVIFLKSDFSGAIMDGVTAKYSNWEGSDFSEASLIGVNFKDSNLKSVSFVNADLRGVNFEGAILDGANFDGANVNGANFKNTEVVETNFAGVRNVSFEQLNQAKFLLSAKSIPEDIVPKKKSWKERFIVPHDGEF